LKISENEIKHGVFSEAINGIILSVLYYPKIFYIFLVSINSEKRKVFFLSRISENAIKNGVFSEAINGIILSVYL